MKPFRAKFILIIIGFVLVLGTIAASVVSAQDLGDDIPIRTDVVIPGSEVEQTSEGFFRGKVADLAGYIETIYTFLISIVGVVAGVAVLIGGYQYLTAGGDAGRVQAAKKRIGNAIIGLVLALGSFTLLNTINPQLVNLEVPELTNVRTELSFLPFCDDLAEDFGLREDLSDITRAPTGGRAGGCSSCGCPGYYEPEAGGEGEDERTRFWCVFRGQRHPGGTHPLGDDRADYGCPDGSIQDDGVFSDTGYPFLSICLPHNGIDGRELDEQLSEEGSVDRLGSCTGCVNLTTGVMELRHQFPKGTGDRACLAWQNTANNGDPNDGSFSYKHKATEGIFQDTRKVSSDDRTTRMYYCGFSEEKQRCVYAPIHCEEVESCGDYEDPTLHYCLNEKERKAGGLRCQGNETLGSRAFRQTGNAKHLIPVCLGNPCDVGGPGANTCQVPGLAGLDAAPGASSIRVGVRIATGGILGDIECTSR